MVLKCLGRSSFRIDDIDARAVHVRTHVRAGCTMRFLGVSVSSLFQGFSKVAPQASWCVWRRGVQWSSSSDSTVMATIHDSNCLTDDVNGQGSVQEIVTAPFIDCVGRCRCYAFDPLELSCIGKFCH